MAAKKSPEIKPDATFEDALRRLEEIVGLLEGGNVPLEQAMSLYEEGIAVSRLCARKLAKAELVLKKLAKDAEGNLAITDNEE
ncbi:MAG: exodeoxyribonuclease VII small subunit [Bacteroidota bacterium]